MNNKSIGFIGAGRITRIFLEGWKRQGKLPATVVVSDINPEAVAGIKSAYPSATGGRAGEAAGQDVVFLAVHPPAMAGMLAGIKDAIKPGAVVVSLAPKFTLARLGELLGGFSRLARVIPNAPSIIGMGYNPVSFALVLSQTERATILDLLQPLGEAPEVEESKLEGYALLTGMGPTYLWFQLQALREVASGFGLSEADITPAMKRMVCGTARTLLESGLTPAEVMDLVPVKPLVEMEAQVSELYRTRLPALHQKIKP
jgi:pyrroline-5-carboxylate reductase